MEFIVNWALLFFAIIGVIEVAGSFALWLHRPKSPPHCMTVAVLPGKCENMEQIVRYIRMVAQWSKGMERAILVDPGLDEESREECLRMCEEGKVVELLRWKEMEKRLSLH